MSTAGEKAQDRFAWGIVGVCIFAGVLSLMGIPDWDAYDAGSQVAMAGFGYGVINLLLAYFDARAIKEAGFGEIDFKWGVGWAFVFPPIYLYIRASKIKRKPIHLYVWIILTILLFAAVGWVS